MIAIFKRYLELENADKLEALQEKKALNAK